VKVGAWETEGRRGITRNSTHLLATSGVDSTPWRQVDVSLLALGVAGMTANPEGRSISCGCGQSLTDAKSVETAVKQDTYLRVSNEIHRIISAEAASGFKPTGREGGGIPEDEEEEKESSRGRRWKRRGVMKRWGWILRRVGLIPKGETCLAILKEWEEFASLTVSSAVDGLTLCIDLVG
jgi:hypothetical protein